MVKKGVLSALQITLANADQLADAGPSLMNNAWRCSVGDSPPAPSRARVKAYLNDPAYAIAAVRDNGTIIGFAIGRVADAKIVWLVVPQGRAAEVGRFLLVRIRNQLGLDPWGNVVPDNVRTALLGMAGMTSLGGVAIKFTG